MELILDAGSVEDYRRFLKAKTLPMYRAQGHSVSFPDEYASMVGAKNVRKPSQSYTPPEWMFDYQKDISRLAIRKRKFATFMDCGLGKTPIHLEFAKHAHAVSGKPILIVAPLMVISQEIQEVRKFYGDSYKMERIKAADLQSWLSGGDGIGITNYEAIREDLTAGKLGGLILVESSMLKSHYGKWGTKLIELGRGLDWKLCETGTPAPNDRIEYANHAVFLDAFSSVNAFLATFFVNRGQTQERWELKPHALGPFYRALSHWSIFVTNPATYGWKDNCETIPPINVHIHDVDLTQGQRDEVFGLTRMLFAGAAGGITSRNKFGQIAKGSYQGREIDTLKPEYIRGLVESWPDESTIIWCIYNAEQEAMERMFPDAASLKGETPVDERERLIDDFKAGRRKVIISKPKVMGFGLNLQIATRQVFSGLQDSYESFYQAVKRSNRYGSTRPLNVHIPITEIERPMVDTVLSKAARVQRDSEEQEAIFTTNKVGGW